MMILAHIIAAIAIISEILFNGVAQLALDSLNIELTSDPTRLTATKNTKLEM
jgi:hypothetical protein